DVRSSIKKIKTALGPERRRVGNISCQALTPFEEFRDLGFAQSPNLGKTADPNRVFAVGGCSLAEYMSTVIEAAVIGLNRMLDRRTGELPIRLCDSALSPIPHSDIKEVQRIIAPKNTVDLA